MLCAEIDAENGFDGIEVDDIDLGDCGAGGAEDAVVDAAAGGALAVDGALPDEGG